MYDSRSTIVAITFPLRVTGPQSTTPCLPSAGSGFLTSIGTLQNAIIDEYARATLYVGFLSGRSGCCVGCGGGAGVWIGAAATCLSFGLSLGLSLGFGCGV